MIDISIITVCYNSEKTILETIKSIKSQTFQNFEYIIIDGNSTDSTLKIVEENLKDLKNIKIVSEPDNGIYDAMNKGISKAEGNIISILNSDDLYYDENVLQNIFDSFHKNNSDIVYGNTYLFNSNNKIIRKIKPGKFKKGKFYWGWYPFHPSTFVKKTVYDKIGTFNLEYRISADFDFLLRAFELNDFRIFNLNIPLAMMRQGGESTGTIKNILNGIKECKLSFKNNNLSSAPFYSIFRIVRILSTYRIF